VAPSTSPPDNRAAWDALAGAYQEHVGWPDEALTWGFRCPPESELRVLGDLTGARVLVLGCGGGQDLVALARMGAARLSGIDISDEQLVHAGARLAAAGRKARLVQGSADDLRRFRSGSVDVVASVQALNYVERLDRCFAEVYRVLVPGGRFAFSVLHAADASTAETHPHAWHRSYFAAQADWTWDGLTEDAVELRSWYPTVAGWATAMIDAGFELERLIEPAPIDDRSWIDRGWLDEASYAKLDLVPATLIVAGRRR